jgi:hypothetical protein
VPTGSVLFGFQGRAGWYIDELHAAAVMGHEAAVEFLLERGAGPTFARDPLGTHFEHPEIAEIVESGSR